MRHYKIPEDDICYTVTVPAIWIWSDVAKQFMKKAAIQVYVGQYKIPAFLHEFPAYNISFSGSWLIIIKNNMNDLISKLLL